jgi:hypothetical protein
MKTKIWLVMFALVMSGWATTMAETMDAVQQRMKARLPVIEALKGKGLIGENNRGYVEFVGSRKENESDVQAENQDRKLVYEAIAQKTGTTDDQVGRRRAQKIAENAPAGALVQNSTGQWQPKK